VEEARAVFIDMRRLADVVREAADGGLRESAPLLVDVTEAARLLGITPTALRKRVYRGQVPRCAVKYIGRRVQFVRTRLVG
jgi:hypothetical protein